LIRASIQALIQEIKGLEKPNFFIIEKGRSSVPYQMHSPYPTLPPFHFIFLVCLNELPPEPKECCPKFAFFVEILLDFRYYFGKNPFPPVCNDFSEDIIGGVT
jgi:hypothetical protein